MKKAKVMLTAVAILTIVGGSLSFKVKKIPIPDRCLFTTLNLSGQTCKLVGLQNVFTKPNGASTIKVLTTTPTTTVFNGPLTCTDPNTGLTIPIGDMYPNQNECVRQTTTIEQ